MIFYLLHARSRAEGATWNLASVELVLVLVGDLVAFLLPFVDDLRVPQTPIIYLATHWTLSKIYWLLGYVMLEAVLIHEYLNLLI